MKISLDRESCIGSGLCAAIAPSVFDIDDDGLAFTLVPQDTELTAEQIGDGKETREAALCCPGSAIFVTESE